MRWLIEILMVASIIGLLALMADMSSKYSAEIRSLKSDCSISGLVDR